MTHSTPPGRSAVICDRIAAELGVRPGQVAAATALLDGGASVPFVARYRKEATDSLDDTQLRHLEERLGYLRELEERRAVILESIEAQGKLDDTLRGAILEASSRARLEDLYLPFRPRRRTRGQVALEAGLAPLADALLDDPSVDPTQRATAYVDEDNGVADAAAALEGARYILMERFAENADLLQQLRQRLREHGLLTSKLVEGRAQEGSKFRDYFDYREPVGRIPSHRALALLRGRREGILSLQLDLEVADGAIHPCVALVAAAAGIEDHGRPGDGWLADTARWTWRVKLQAHMESELLGDLRERAELEAIEVFARNLGDLLLAAPAGGRPCIGLDPGLRTGIKVAVLDGTGRLLEHATLYPHAPRKRWDEAVAWLAAAARRHGSELVAIGNGTASRETERLARDVARQHPELRLQPVVVSEAGASVYSASELAARELPDVDVTIRGAVSIARRLQDPLAELVKIEPRSIGVGQYQHDVSQGRLARRLDAVVEDCVNAVGVDLNTASAALLQRVAGLSPAQAASIVERRNEQGPYRRRSALLDVKRLGPRTFEQCAGFLRIRDGDEPLDASAVHPESYAVARRMAADCGATLPQLIGNRTLLERLDVARYVGNGVGLPTLRDIVRELEKPGRDPRPEFRSASFREGIDTLRDLEPGMILEGVVTNVTNFGAFVDIGVHQDGLIHVSALADRFVKNPHDEVRAGDVVKVRVLDVDIERQRIALSRRLAADRDESRQRDTTPAPTTPPKRRAKRQQAANREPGTDTTLATAFRSARDRRQT